MNFACPDVDDRYARWEGNGCGFKLRTSQFPIENDLHSESDLAFAHVKTCEAECALSAAFIVSDV